MHSYPAAAPREKNGKDSKIYCNKRDGVCSTRPFNKDLASGEITFGQITATCPFRFIENGTIFEAIGNKVLGTPEATLIKEVTFLNRVSQSNSANVISDQETEGPPSPKNRGREDVGRIDMVLVDPQLDPLNWCAVELQAVYFSGKAMSEDFAVMRKHEGDEFPFPPSPR
jgi:hypothetical protein